MNQNPNRNRLALLLGLALGLGLSVSVATPLAEAAAPPGRYVTTSSTVQDTATGLEWALLGATFTRSRIDADYYCRNYGAGNNEWRLPEAYEILSIVDPTESMPAVDPTAFGGSVASTWYWAKNYDAAGNGAWLVNIGTGQTTSTVDVNALRPFFCVRPIP